MRVGETSSSTVADPLTHVDAKGSKTDGHRCVGPVGIEPTTEGL
jgi:hypothetical protein